MYAYVYVYVYIYMYIIIHMFVYLRIHLSRALRRPQGTFAGSARSAYGGARADGRFGPVPKAAAYPILAWHACAAANPQTKESQIHSHKLRIWNFRLRPSQILNSRGGILRSTGGFPERLRDSQSVDS